MGRARCGCASGRCSAGRARGGPSRTASFRDIRPSSLGQGPEMGKVFPEPAPGPARPLPPIDVLMTEQDESIPVKKRPQQNEWRYDPVGSDRLAGGSARTSVGWIVSAGLRMTLPSSTVSSRPPGRVGDVRSGGDSGAWIMVAVRAKGGARGSPPQVPLAPDGRHCPDVLIRPTDLILVRRGGSSVVEVSQGVSWISRTWQSRFLDTPRSRRGKCICAVSHESTTGCERESDQGLGVAMDRAFSGNKSVWS
jgi:hypothetical protein